MKKARHFARVAPLVLGLLVAGFLWSGCQTEQTPVYPQPPPRSITDAFQVGDPVTVHFSGLSDPNLLPDITETIKDDGTITLYLIGSVKAAGKTPGDLQKELQGAYRKYYPNLTVTVAPSARYYYVAGEVNKQGLVPYVGDTDVVKAIAAAGGFTEFANKKKVRITHQDGRSQIVNVLKAIEYPSNPKYDAVVVPGDKIIVPRRRW